ncbi:MAG: LolA family protein [Chthoniobacteraceae bacterium]|nr:LolA family protein [Chthoniobacteraceae bacterium]
MYFPFSIPMRLLFFFIALILPAGLHAVTPADLTPVKKWLARQDEFRSVTADVVQTRALRALRSPLSTPGHLWFVAPDNFRWELGDPVKTIVVRKGNVIDVITPAKKRIERHSATSVGQKAGAQGLAMMNFQFAKDIADFQKQFEVLAIEVTGQRCHLEVAPRDPQTRKMVAAIKIDFDTTSGQMFGFEISTRDGSALRNEFSNVRVNAKIDRHVFEFDPTGYEIINAK